MRHPALNATQIVFQFAGDLWSVPRAGGQAQRLTTSPAGNNSGPCLSPDGTQIAFTGSYDGNTDVYVMPANGGLPKRLTTHPAPDIALGWTPDGKSVVFSSPMNSGTDYLRIFTVPATGGVTTQLPFPAGVDTSFSSDGQKIALVPNPKWEQAWKRYRGGQTTPIWVANLSDSKISPIPRRNTNDFNPVWSGDSIYYLSDPTGIVGLNKFDTKSGHVSTVVPGNGFDLKSFSKFGDTIAYEKLGSIHLLDLRTGKDHAVPVEIDGDFAEPRTAYKNVADQISDVELSPSGQRAVVTARGFVFTAPAQKGDVRLLDEKQGLHRKSASWSPDGESIAYFSDQGGTIHLVVQNLHNGESRDLVLGDSPADYGQIVWSPDSTKIAYTSNKLHLWTIDVKTGTNTLIDSGYRRVLFTINPKWSPDSKWLAYSRDLKNFTNAVFLYSFETGKATQVTQGVGDSTRPVFDRSGKYLYFLVSTNVGFGIDVEDIQALGLVNTTSNVYAMLLRKDIANPLAPQSDEEKGKEETKNDKKDVKFSIDLDGIDRRVVLLPFPELNYQSLEAGPAESVFALSQPPRNTFEEPPSPGTLQKFSFPDRKVSAFAEGTKSFGISADGAKVLLNQGDWRIVASDGSQAAPGGNLDLRRLDVKIDPRSEWKAMYHEVWRMERILFYDPGLHGINADLMEKRYEPFIDGIQSRDDLNYLFTDMLGELCIGHMFISGGDRRRPNTVPGGLLGADYKFDKGRYQIARVYDGESWNPNLQSPLGAPGVNGKAGEYILAINGRDLKSTDDIYLALEGQAGKQVRLKLGPSADGVGAREVTTVAIGNDFGLREKAWEEDNRRYVEKETGGLGGYVHVPDTSESGLSSYMRYYYSQNDKQGMIIDDRFNHGGYIASFLVRELEKPLDFFGATRYGEMYATPNAMVYGPKVMLINELAGSGGDIFPYLFRAHGIGKLVGHTTWGGELSAYGFTLIDGGSIRAPDDANFDPKSGQYVIDNTGVSPDIAVELDPAAWRNGIDLQLQIAVQQLNREMAKRTPFKIVRPPYPDKSKLPSGR